MKKEPTPIEMYLKAMYEFRARTVAVGLMCKNMYMVKKGGNVYNLYKRQNSSEVVWNVLK